MVLALSGGLAIILVVGALLGGASIGGLGGAQPAPRYVDEAPTAGVDQRYDGDDYYVGGGVAAFDCDEDGKAELYIAGGSSTAGLFHNDSEVAGPLRFSPLPGEATDLGGVTGAYPLDVDGDALADLVVLRRGGNVVLRGTGDCGFEPANEAWNLDRGDAWSTAFSATWEAGATWPTVAVGNYLDEASTDRERLCFDNQLIRPNDQGSGFAEPTVLSPGWCSLSMLFSDWDRSGRRDLRVSNDRHYYNVAGDGEEQLWRVAAGESPRLYTESDGWLRVRVWGMGIGSYDVTDDGYPDYYLTSQADNKLQTLAEGPAQPTYEDIALERGALATRPYAGDTTLPSTAWHAEFQDVNNDGFIDLFVAKGNVEAMPDYAARDPSNLLIGQADGTFVEGAEEAGILNFAKARGATLTDLNLDGLLDLVVVYRREPVGIWRNVGAGDAEATEPTGHWLALRLVEADPNRDAIGSWVEIRTGDRVQRREITVGGGHVGGQLGWIHVGLGRAEEAEVRVQWPDGEAGPWLTIGADQFAIVDREAGSIEPGTPGN
jgi:hypothetical protein